MNKLLFGFFILFAFGCNSTKGLKTATPVLQEKGYELKILFQPNSEYVTNLEQVTNTSTSISSMPDQIAESKVSSSSTLKFGPLINNECEMLVSYDEMDMQMTGMGSEQFKTPELAGMKIYGKLKDGVQSIDSIVGGEQSMQTMLKSLMEPLFSNMKIDFPNPMKIGDEFLDTKITDIPIEGMGSTTITTETKYTLIKVTNDIADLTTQIKMSGIMSIMGSEFPLKGSGSGDMSLDLIEHYSPSSSTVIDQETTMEMQGMEMKQKLKVSIKTKTQKVK